jgi:hypothetical protein
MADPRDESDLERELQRLYEEGGRLNPPYWARRFRQMFTPGCARYIGGVAAVRKVLDAGSDTSGLMTVLKAGREDLSVENVILSHDWEHLFKAWDHEKARQNLRLAKAKIKARAK